MKIKGNMTHFHSWQLINSEESGIIAVCDCGSQVLGKEEVEIVLNSTLHYGTFDIHKAYEIHDSYWAWVNRYDKN